MLRNIFLLLIFSLLLSCGNSQSYLVNYQSLSQEIENQDHQKCVAQGFENKAWNDLATEMYWRCRYNLVQARKPNYLIGLFSVRNKGVLDRISQEILQNINQARYYSLVDIEDKIQLEKQYNCIDEFGIYSDNCSQNRLKNPPQIISPFPNSEYLGKRSAEYFDIANQIRAEKKAKIELAAVQKYPNCAGLDSQSDDFKDCALASEQSKQCLENFNNEQNKKDWADKSYCQKQSFIQFPDNYALAKDKSAQEIEKLRLENAKAKNNQDLIEENNSLLNNLQSDKNINSGKYIEDVTNKEERAKGELYSRVELIKLRERFVYQCNKKVEDKKKLISKQAIQDCLNIGRSWKE